MKLDKYTEAAQELANTIIESELFNDTEVFKTATKLLSINTCDIKTSSSTKKIKESNTTIVGYPFVSHVDQDKRPTITNAENYLKKVYDNNYSCAQDISRTGMERAGGYRYDFKSLLNKFLYLQHGNWNQAYAPNKTLLRAITYGKIDKILEI